MNSAYFQRNAPVSDSEVLTQYGEDETAHFGNNIEPCHAGESIYDNYYSVPEDFKPSVQSDGILRSYSSGISAIPAQRDSNLFSSGASAGAVQVYFPEIDTWSPSYATSIQGSPTPLLSRYQGRSVDPTGIASHFYSQSQYTDIDSSAQLDSNLQMTDFNTATELYAQPPFTGAVRSQDQGLVDPRTLQNDLIPAYHPPSLLPWLPPTQAHPQTFQIPSLDHDAGSSATSLSPITPPFSSQSALGTILEIDVPSHQETIDQSAPRPIWTQSEEPQPVEACQSPLAKADKKRTLDSAGVVDHSFDDAAPSSTGIGLRSAKQPSTSRVETTATALQRHKIDSNASSYKGYSSDSSAAGDLSVSVAGPSCGSLAAERREDPTREYSIQWLRSLDNKDLKSILIETGKMRTEKISGEKRSKCSWEGCTNRPRKRPRDVLRHIRTAHLEQNAMCILCHKVFKREDSRTRHTRKEHPQHYAATTLVGSRRRGGGKYRRGVHKTDRG